MIILWQYNLSNMPHHTKFSTTPLHFSGDIVFSPAAWHLLIVCQTLILYFYKVRHFLSRLFVCFLINCLKETLHLEKSIILLKMCSVNSLENVLRITSFIFIYGGCAYKIYVWCGMILLRLVLLSADGYYNLNIYYQNIQNYTF